MKKEVVICVMLFIILVFTGCNADMNIESSNQNEEQNFTETNEPSSSTEQPEKTERPQANKYECNIPFDFSKYPEHTRFALSTVNGFDPMINEIKKIDPSFDSERYFVWINHYAANDETTCAIRFTYYIGNLIQTNKTYAFSVKNNTIVELRSLDRPIPENREEHEQTLLDRVNNFKASYDPDEIDMSNVIEIRERYLYNYDTGELRYVHSVFREVEGTIQDEVMEITIK